MRAGPQHRLTTWVSATAQDVLVGDLVMVPLAEGVRTSGLYLVLENLGWDLPEGFRGGIQVKFRVTWWGWWCGPRPGETEKMMMMWEEVLPRGSNSDTLGNPGIRWIRGRVWIWRGGSGV